MVFFAQLIRQLGNIAHCTSPKQPNYLHYFHLLEQLATIRFGLVLVELCRTMDDNQEALDILQELVRTLLSVVHIDHAQEVSNHAATAVASILEEFDVAIPIPILDEVLTCIAAGPVIMVTNPAAVEAAAKLASRKKSAKDKPEAMPPSQIQQTNPSYLVAANAIRKVGEKVASPISAFLNGLWNGDPMIVEQTSISTDDTNPNVWATIYELHKIAPQILTTVIGTVAASLTAPEEEMRIKVVKLLGRLFYSPNSNIGTQFSPCFREWLRRHVDVSSKVRMTMAKYLVTILAHQKTDLSDEATATLQTMISADPDVNVRISAIHQVCDLAYKSPHLITSTGLLRAVGDRVSSKTKTERKDSLTGLAQIYHKHYILPKLKHVESGGDDCAIEIVMDALHKGDSEVLDDRYGWIAAKVFECASFWDDVEMRNRVIQIVDDIFLGRSTLSGTSRAVGLAIIIDSLNKPSNANAWMGKLLSQRAALQIALRKYIDARSVVRRCKPGTEEVLTADAHAMECLESVAAMTGALSHESSPAVLEKLHTARDNHIFKILATIADPTHTIAARTRALDELPKRTKSLGDAAASWVRTLVRRTAMGHFVNIDTVHHAILLAHECLSGGDYQGCGIFLECLNSITAAFPSLCANKEDFANLLELFTECRGVTNAKAKEQVKQLELVTTLSCIVAAAAQASKNGRMDEELQGQLLNLCTRDGTPEQAQHAVQTIVALLVDESSDEDGQKETLAPLLKALTSPSRLNLSLNSGSSKVIGALAALSALAERMPSLFQTSDLGSKAIKFALDTVLLGRRDSFDKADDDDEEEDIATEGRDSSKSPKRRRQSNQSPGAKKILEDEGLSIACRRACAAVEFLVTRIRSALIAKRVLKANIETPSSEHISKVFSVLTQILQDQGIPPGSQDRRDCRSRQDRASLRESASIHLFRLCDTRLQLVDSHLSIAMWHTLSSSLLDEEKRVRETIMGELGLMLTGKGAYAMGGSPQPANLRFLAMMVFCVDSEGNAIANGNAAHVGKACHAVKGAAKIGIVGLRQTMEATLNQCRAVGKDAERNFENYLKKKIMPEYSVPFAIHLLSFRRETPSAGGIVAGMPGATQLAGDESGDEDIGGIDDSAHQKNLRKRLRWLFEPLVLSLGDSADNISFLLRMTEMIGNQFHPRDIKATATNLVLSGNSDDSFSSPIAQYSEETRTTLPTAKMKTTCAAARDVLLAFVKKDVNLTPYPGQIDVPTSVFQKLTLSSIKAVQHQQKAMETPAILRSVSRRPHSTAEKKRSLSSIADVPESLMRESEEEGGPDSPRLTRSRRMFRESIDSLYSADTAEQNTKRTRASLDSASATNTLIASQDSRDSFDQEEGPSRRKSRVTFSPEVVNRTQHTNCASSQSPTSFGGMSPIVMSDSPAANLTDSPAQRIIDVGIPHRKRKSSSLDTENVKRGATKQGSFARAKSRPTRVHQTKPLLSSQESATTTPETQSSVDDHDSPYAVRRPATDSDNENTQQMNKKLSKARPRKPAPVKIKAGLSQSSSDSAVNARGGARNQSKRSSRHVAINEFDFSDELVCAEKENVTGNTGDIKRGAKSKGVGNSKAKSVKKAALTDRTGIKRGGAPRQSLRS